MAAKTILSGMRPSGKLHLGNYFGALSNWLTLQKEASCYFMVADWHALTSEYADPSSVESNVWDMVIDWLACGLDPKKAVIFRQSWVPQHAELHLILSMMTPLSWLERVPTYKEQQQEMINKDLSTYGFLGYPLLQSADILLYRATHVPVGEDQLPHIELTREIARRFNHIYKANLPEPQSALTKTPKVMGLDGRKMSKSYNNAIYLSDSAADVTSKVKSMFTDPTKVRLNDKGHPEGCVVFNSHKLYTPEVAEIEQRCKAGTIGCVACKGRLNETLNGALEPIRAERAALASQLPKVKEIVMQGSQQAVNVATSTMTEVHRAIQLAAPSGKAGAS